MKTHTSYLTFNTKKRHEIIDITEEVEKCRDYRHNSGTGEDNAAAHLRSLTVGHEVIVPVTKGKLGFGPWQRVFSGQWVGQSHKGVLATAKGE